jgi:SAM-dependent methyltransferase
MHETGWFYSSIIDPVLGLMRKRVARKIEPGQSIIDVACGTGAQIFTLCPDAQRLVGIDLSESMIAYAKNKAVKSKCKNVEFYPGDAGNLNRFKANEFDIATMTLALHQFEPKLHAPILAEMKRVARKLILVDYNVPLPKSLSGTGCKVAEFFAGGEHHRNFKRYVQKGGLVEILNQHNFTINEKEEFAGGAFLLVVAE